MYIHPLRPLTFRDSHDAMESARGPRLIQVPMKAEDWCRGTLQCHETWLAGEMGTALERYHWKIWKINYSSIAYIEMKLSRWEKSSNLWIVHCHLGLWLRVLFSFRRCHQLVQIFGFQSTTADGWNTEVTVTQIGQWLRHVIIHMGYHQKGLCKGYVLEWNIAQNLQKRRWPFKTKANLTTNVCW